MRLSVPEGLNPKILVLSKPPSKLNTENEHEIGQNIYILYIK